MPITKIHGIYKITNATTGKTYIGQAWDIKDRIRRHRYELNKGIHTNKYLQRSYSLHGPECFSFVILHTIEGCAERSEEAIKKLNDLEKKYIEEFESFTNGYNLTTGGENKIVSASTIEKLRVSHKGRVPSEHCRRVTSIRMKGYNPSAETRLKLGKSIKRAWDMRVDRHVVRKPGYKCGPASPERKRKIGEAQLGEKNHNYGKHIPEDVKQKCRDSYHGAQCHLAKLDDDKVRAIKMALSEGQKGSDLAKQYGVAKTQISSIKHGKTWRHVK